MYMNKSLFVLPVLALLTACQPSISTSLEQDKQWLFSCTEENFSSSDEHFSSSLGNIYKDGVYLVTYKIDQPKEDYHHVKVIVTPDNKASFFFGYDKDYTLVSDVARQDSSAQKYSGLKISFTSSVKIEKLKVLFKADDLSLVYEIQNSEQ